MGRAATVYRRRQAGSNPVRPTKLMFVVDQRNCAVKHKVAIWTGYGCLPVGTHYVLSKNGASLNGFSRP